MREIHFCAVGPVLERSSCAQLKSRVPYKRDAYKRAMTVQYCSRQEPPKEACNMVSSNSKNFFSSFQPFHGRCYLTTGPGLWPEVGRHRRCCLELLRPVLCPSCRGLAPLAPEAAAAATVQSMQQGHRSSRRPRPLSRRLGQPLENRDSLAESQQPLCVAPSATP